MNHLAIIGVGDRGRYLASIVSVSNRAQIVAVADSDRVRRAMFRKEFSLPRSHCYPSYRDLIRSGVDLDGVMIATPPTYHAAIACAFLEAGVPVFLEKPMATNLKDADRIVRIARKTGVRLQVGFNLRYSPFFVTLKEVTKSNTLGKIISLEWKEVLSPRHWASYCRLPSYNRRNMIGSWVLEKCCHDIDIMNWLIESPCVRVASFGNRTHFNPMSDFPGNCTTDCPIEKKCIFFKSGTPCVYNVKSDLVDHQSSILEYANGVTVCFSLMPLGRRSNRLLHICGTEATLRGDFLANEIRLVQYQTREEIVYAPEGSKEGHGGGDPLLVSSFLDWLEDPMKQPKTTTKEGWQAMQIGCAIDLALRKRRVVSINGS